MDCCRSSGTSDKLQRSITTYDSVSARYRTGWHSLDCGLFSEYGRVTTPASTQAPSETSAPCVLALTLGTTEFSAAGGTTTGRITANRADCAWTVQAPAWASVVPASGTGTADMVVTVSVADGARAGVVTLGATQVTIQQVAPMPVACAVTLAMSDAHVPAGGGAIEGAIVATRSDCDWTVLASDWLSVSPERGRGSGTVVVSVPPQRPGCAVR